MAWAPAKFRGGTGADGIKGVRVQAGEEGEGGGYPLQAVGLGQVQKQAGQEVVIVHPTSPYLTLSA